MKITHPDVERARNALFQVAVAIAKSPARGKTFVIFGENGTGKTRLANKMSFWMTAVAQKIPLVRREDLEDGPEGLAWSFFVHWPRVIDDFQKEKINVPVETICQSTLAVIDDIGAEHDPSGYGREQLYLLLCRREFRWSIFTTNFPPEKWNEKFERRIASRLFRNAEHIDLSKVPDFSTQ